MKNKDVDALLKNENDYLSKLHQIVSDSIREEDLLIKDLLHPPLELLTTGQRITDKVARFGGSWKFIILFGTVLTVWIMFNVIALTRYRFDPYPFILMNLVLSCIAALQAPVIMMSQNRQEEKDRIRGENDYMINLKSELQIRSLHQKVDLLLGEQIKTLYDSQAEQFKFLKELDKKMDILCSRNK